MASLKQLVKAYKEDLLDGIQWVVFWKDGRSWHADTIFTEIDDDNPDPEYNPITLDTKEDLLKIYDRDNKAIILNGYYCGCIWEDMTQAELLQSVRNYYKNQEMENYKIKKFLEEREVILSKKDEKEITEAAELLKTVRAEVNLTQTIEGQKFLDSEAGGDLIDTVLKWDNAINQGDSEKIKEHVSYWSGVQAVLKYFTGLAYHFSRTEKECGIVDDNGNWLFRVR